MIIDADPVSARPARAEDLVRDQPQIDQAPVGQETSGAQVCHTRIRRQTRMHKLHVRQDQVNTRNDLVITKYSAKA
jgi:hypothetical protein